jgi:hypothetical protein
MHTVLPAAAFPDASNNAPSQQRQLPTPFASCSESDRGVRSDMIGYCNNFPRIIITPSSEVQPWHVPAGCACAFNPPTDPASCSVRWL